MHRRVWRELGEVASVGAAGRWSQLPHVTSVTTTQQPTGESATGCLRHKPASCLYSRDVTAPFSYMQVPLYACLLAHITNTY